MNRIANKAFLRTIAAWLLPGLIVLIAQQANADGLLIKLRPAARIQDIHRAHHTVEVSSIPGTRIHLIRSANRRANAGLLAELTRDRRIQTAESDQSARLKANTYYFAKDGRFGGAALGQPYVQVDDGPASRYVGGTGVVVALLDTGADLDHPALVGHLTAGYNFVAGNNDPSDLPDDPANPSASPATGHGTFNAGIVAHLAPGTSIMPLKVLDGQGNGSLSAVVAAIYWAKSHNANVINMSFSSAQPSSLLTEALRAARAAGIVVVASVGNDGSQAATYPAASPNVVGVASVDPNNVLSTFSNYGNSVDVVAPGDGIRSAYWNDNYATGYGTSFAAPFVSGLAALLLSARSDGPHNLAPYPLVIKAIHNSANSVDAFNPGYARQLGYGLIDCDEAIWTLWGYDN